MTYTKINIACLTLALALSGCGSSPESRAVDDNTENVDNTITTAPAPAVQDHSDWAGKWIGPEGMYVQITPTGVGVYDLEMQSDLDTKGTYKGREADGGISFQRGGEDMLLRAATGDQTGLKYLAGKPNCLMVKSGEGYCKES